jgi:hypothetical protein
MGIAPFLAVFLLLFLPVLRLSSLSSTLILAVDLSLNPLNF